MRKSLLFKIQLILFFVFACVELKAQDSPIQPAFDSHTKEIYDLLVDKHGFLWIANDFGVARYDGISCVYYSSPNQISLGCTDLLEDNYGRIWFHNFNGQIFYIKNETVTLVTSYNYKKESNYPRVVLFHDKLIATSDSGLFVLDTKTLAGKYIHSNYTTSLSLLSNQVLVHGGKNWYSYSEKAGLKKLAYVGDDQIAGHAYVLANDGYRDTAYMMSNPSGTVTKLVIKNDTVKQVKQIVLNSFINTLTISPDNQWVNTTDYSYSLKTGEKIKGDNLSDIVTDLEGNRWFSSLYYGLLIQYKKDLANKTVVPNLDNDDLVVSIKSCKDKLLMGTRKGYLMLYNPATKHTDFKIKLSASTGSINNIAAINDNEFIIGSSLFTFKVNITTQKVVELPYINTVKQACADDKATYVASAGGLFVIPHEKSDLVNKQINEMLGHVFKYNEAGNYFYLSKRSRAICYFPDQSALIVSVRNSLFKIDKSGMKPFLYNNDQVYAASLAYVDHRLFIGTIANGMLVVGKSDTEHISVQNGLFSKAIFKIKPINDNVWIVGSGPLQAFNFKKRELVNNYEFPDRNASQMFDLDGAGKIIYLTTPTGVDSFPLEKNSADKKLKNYLQYLKVNNRFVAPDSSYDLSYEENNVVFNIGVPAYLKAKDIYIKYALVTKTDTTWQTTEPGERTIHFSALSPGAYTLRAIAIDPRLGVADAMITHSFIISEPWWDGWAFKIFVAILFLLAIFYGYLIQLRKRLSLKTAFETQQQLILAERQRISAEMHDDIGSGVFAIHSVAHNASKGEHASSEMSQIKNMLDDLSVKIREVIWTTNVGNDNLEHLLVYTYFQINKLFEYSDIDFVSELPDVIPDVNITGQSRRNIYLLVKELVHNAIKHSQGTTIELKMSVNDDVLYMAVNDNGVGINEKNGRPDSMGLGNIKSRVEKLNGTLSIENNNGAHISFTIPISQLRVVEFDKKLNRWQAFIARFFKIHSGNHQDQ